MTRAEFLSAAAKGLGRAVAALRAGDFQVSFHDLRRLALRWPGYDLQCESTRGWYTVELMKASTFEAELTELVIRHFYRTKGWWASRRHREGIVVELAKRGVKAAKDAVYSRADPADDFQFTSEVLECDGLNGLDWVISQSSEFLVPEYHDTFKFWIQDLEKAVGKEVVSEWLAREAETRPQVAEFTRLISLDELEFKKPRQAPTTFEALCELGRRPRASLSVAMSWAIWAEDSELEKAWRALEVEEDPEWLRRLGRGLSKKPKHCDLDKIIARAQTWNRERNPFVRAVAEIVDPSLRQLGFELIQAGWVADGIDLLATNALPGDESALVAAASALTDPLELHSVGCDLLRLGKTLDTGDVLLWLYENSHCSFCRESAVNDLIERSLAPEWLLQECLLDCVDDIREMAANALDPTSRRES